MSSKFGNMTRRRPAFEQGAADAEAAKLKKFSDGGGPQRQWLSDAVRNKVLKLFGYKPQQLTKHQIPILTIKKNNPYINK